MHIDKKYSQGLNRSSKKTCVFAILDAVIRVQTLDTLDGCHNIVYGHVSMENMGHCHLLRTDYGGKNSADVFARRHYINVRQERLWMHNFLHFSLQVFACFQLCDSVCFVIGKVGCHLYVEMRFAIAGSTSAICLEYP